MNKELNAHLFDMILKEMIEYPGVEAGIFFGLDVLKVRGKTFAMVWKEGRVGVKILNQLPRLATGLLLGKRWRNGFWLHMNIMMILIP